MRRNRQQANGQLAHHFASLAKEDMSPEFYMFTEDLNNGLMPYPRLLESGSYSVSVGNDPRGSELLQSLSRRDRFLNNEELLYNAVSEIGRYLVWEGCAVYQIIPDNIDSRILRLNYCTSAGLFKLAGYYIQYVPVADRAEFSSSFLITQKSNIWEIGMPDILGGIRAYRNILKDLKRYTSTFPEFLTEDLRAQRITQNFDAGEYIRCKKAVNARLTRGWGWSGRDTSLEHETEFFHCYRTIIFRWSQAVLRNHIVNELNDLFRRLHFNSEITMTGIPTPDSILEVKNKMEQGTITFSEAYKATLLFD